MKNKTLALLLGIAAIIASLGILIWAIGSLDSKVYNGTCGDNLTWMLSDGTLTISGTGAMTDYNLATGSPWEPYRKSVKKVIICNGVTSIGNSSFQQSNLKEVSIPNSVTSIGKDAFFNCERLKSVNIPNGVTSIGSSAFNYCKRLKSIHIPNSVTSIGSCAFDRCARLESIHIPNGVTSIEYHAFNACRSFETISIPYGVTSIEGGALLCCKKLKSVTIPNTVTKIGRIAFAFCSSMTSVTIPASVKKIEELAFSDCPNLTIYTASSADLSQSGVPADRIVKITQEEAMERYLKENPNQEEYVRQHEQEQQMKVQQRQQQKQQKAKSKGHLLYNGFEIKGKRSECYDKILRGVISYPLNEDNDAKISIYRTAPPFDEAEYALCLIYVEGTPKTDQVFCVDDIIAFNDLLEDNSAWTDIKKVYLKRKESLIKIYGKPKYVEEYFESPYSETNNPIKSIEEGKIHYRTEIVTDKGRIIHTITKDGPLLHPYRVFTAYIDAEGEYLYKQER